MSVSTPTSRVGRKPVTIPPGVDIKVDGKNVSINGPKGKIELPMRPFAQIILEGTEVKVCLEEGKGTYCRSGSGERLRKSIIGTVRAEINNAVHGVTAGFERKLILVGVGYRAQSKGKILGLTLGFSHPVEFSVPDGVTIETPTQTEIVIKGMDKHLVGHTASMIRDIRSPEPYKGKGIRYSDEVISLKETKKK